MIGFTLGEIIGVLSLSKEDVEKEADYIEKGFEPSYCALIGFSAAELREIARKMGA